MTAIIILIAVLFVLNILVIGIYARLCKRLPLDFDADYFDEDGNHIYYDRRIIATKRRAKEKVPSEN